MNTANLSLNFNERVMFTLRSLYSMCGFTQYKMSKFEEYDLYAKNKDFLISDSIITFTDTNGKLMALKPDVTLSIIKNSKDLPDTIQKVYYNENVYRISKGTQGFKEIMQVGLECFGNIDSYNICEILTLACKSLKTISNDAVLDISHLGIMTSVLDAIDVPSYARKDILKFIGEKNIHQLSSLCSELEISENNIELLKEIVNTTGKADEVLPYLEDKLEGVIDTAPLKEFSAILNALDSDIKNIINIDFSVVSDTHYYNNIVFKGFINGIPSGVLSGGQYDKLMQKMKRKSGAIGFAVYLDLLERLESITDNYDVDCVLLYDKNEPVENIKSNVDKLTLKGLKVLACSALPNNLKYKELITLKNGEVSTVENNA
ncbi:MAG: ATP phosphoribosyltransferase regulatory subunit [Ruminococcus sp.]|nr:ATP phosphoribosyltransferase regulatory subunit [Ruminococcus sp.]